ncbi:reverse transcriptase domain-containing protein [Tanacetum coccineum]
MTARGGRNNLVARRVIDDLIDINGERSPLKYLKIFIEQQISDHRRFIACMRDEIRTSTNLISQLNELIVELEVSGDYEELFDLVMKLRDDKRDEQDKVADFNRLIAVAGEKIHGKEIDLEMLEAEGNDVVVGCAIRIMETQAIDDQDPLVNYDNDNENDNLGYQSEEYFDEVQEDDENNHSRWNDIRKTQSIVFKFFRRHAKMARSKSVYEHTIGRGRYALVKEKMIEKKKIKPDEEPARGTLWLKGRVNKDGEYPDDEIRSVGDKLVSLVDINPINSSDDEEGGTTVVGCKNEASIQKSNGLATLEKEMETRVSNKTSPYETVKSVESKNMTRSIRKDSSRQDSQSQENVSPLLVLPQAIKCKLWHLKKSTIIALGTVYKTDGKQMLHNKELPKDCYKVSIDTSLVDVACLLDVGNNGFKTVKDAISLSPPSAGERLVRSMAPPAHSSPPPVPSPLLPSSECPTQIQTLRITSTQALIDAVTAALPSPPLPPLPPSLYIPPPVDRRDDIPDSEQSPRKRLYLSTLGSIYEVSESSTARPRGIDYGFVSTIDAEERRQGTRDVGYGIRDTWVDSAGTVPEIAPMTVGEVNTRVTELAELHEHDTQDLYALLEDAQDSRSRISQ